MGKGRRLRSIARDADDLSAVNALQHASQPVEVHRLLQTVVHRLIDQRMVGDLAVAGDVLETRGRIRKDRGHQIVGHGALKLRSNLASSAIPRDGQGDRGVPAPARLKDRRVEKRLHQHVSRGRRMEITEDIGQGKGMLRPQGEQHRIVGGRRLQLEVELPAEAFAERQPPRLVDPASERRVDDELHAARLIEEALDDERLLRGDDAESDARRVEVLEDLAGRGFRDSGLLDQALDRMGLRTKIADRARELVASRRRLAQPERNVRRRSFRVSNAHHAAAHLHHLPRGVAELEDVAGHALDSEVFVERADEYVFRLEEHAIVGNFRDRSSGGDREHSRAAAAAHLGVHFIAMHERAASSAPRGETVGDHLHDGIEIAARQLAIRPCPAHEREKLIFGIVGAR